MSKDLTPQELQAARARFYALAGVPNPEQAKPVDEYMEAWKLRGAGNATEQFIRLNEQRVQQGLPPLGADGQAINPIRIAPPPLEMLPNPGEVDDFFAQPIGGVKVAKRVG